ncbi:hypothetical protein MN116_005268 [Schistosoma mekongi]|uniref:Cytochrome c oxidase copper chaperone n=1 Tax=Schistosoma mekongi TaxID=38744 RepID=A0AAE2D5A1_SCHME|nr:hypothetical protein MN116_005268 [Schistosoma mekongi]
MTAFLEETPKICRLLVALNIDTCSMSSSTQNMSSQYVKKVLLDDQDKPLKPCCACPETRLKRDQCILTHGEEMCADLIMEHKECLRKLGFTM